MDDESRVLMARLLHEQRVAALGTLDELGAPRAALVPYAIAADRASLLVHISHLAAHTRDLARDDRASLLVAEADRSSRNPSTLARLALQGVVEVIATDAPEFAAECAAYLERLPASAITFQLGDFLLCRFRPVAARFVAGFGRAFDVEPQEFQVALRSRQADT